MDSKIPTSFIPKNTINTNLRDRREPVGIVFIVSLLLLTASLVYFAGLYGYRYLVDNELNAPCQDTGNGGKKCGLKESLKMEVADLQLAKLENLKRLDTKLKNGSAVLGVHVTLKPFFDQLTQLTNQNIQYQKFQFDKDNVFILDGLAKSYDDIAFQQKVFGTDEAQKYIKGFSFSDFNTDAKGNILFKLTLTVDPKLLSYTNQTQ